MLLISITGLLFSIYLIELPIIFINTCFINKISQLIFGNFDSGKINKKIIHKFTSAPNAEYVAKWAEKFGKTLSIHDIDFVEPDYLKDFIVKEKKL